MRHFIIAGFLFCFYLSAMELGECFHDPSRGISTLTWKNQPSNIKTMLIYRLDEPIDDDNIFFAECFSAPAEQQKVQITSSGSGKFYYLLQGADALRRIKRNVTLPCGPFDERDISAPSALAFKEILDGGRLCLSWSLPGIANPEKIEYFQIKTRGGEVIAKYSLRDRAKFVLPAPVKDGSNEYTLSAVDRCGNESEPFKYYKYGDFPDFKIDGSCHAATNSDVSLERMYPLLGIGNRISFRITNQGGAAGEALVKIADVSEQDIRLSPGESTEVSINWQPTTAGRQVLTVKIDSTADQVPDNNTLKLELFALEKEVHFIWYGDASDLIYATAGSAFSGTDVRWGRRGGKALVITGRHTSAEGYKKHFPSSRYSGMQYDELGGNIKPAKYLAALREFRLYDPKCFIALWHIGGNISPEIVEAVKDGTIDLLLPERYFTYGQPIAQMEKEIAQWRKLGILEKTVVGLGTRKSYAGFANAEQHSEFLEQQIALIRRLAPEMPGLAFYSTATLPGVKEKVDQLCRKYFLEHGQ